MNKVQFIVFDSILMQIKHLKLE